MSLKDNIRTKRLEKKITLEELANRVGTTKQTIQKYESGVISNIPLDKIEKLAEALDCSPAFLVGWKKDCDKDENLFLKYEKLNKEDKDIIKWIIEQLAEKNK